MDKKAKSLFNNCGQQLQDCLGFSDLSSSLGVFARKNYG